MIDSALSRAQRFARYAASGAYVVHGRQHYLSGYGTRGGVEDILCLTVAAAESATDPVLDVVAGSVRHARV